MDINYYDQVLLEENQYVAKEIVSEYINDDMKISSDSDREDSDEETSKKENSDETTLKPIQYLLIIFSYISKG